MTSISTGGGGGGNNPNRTYPVRVPASATSSIGNRPGPLPSGRWEAVSYRVEKEEEARTTMDQDGEDSDNDDELQIGNVCALFCGPARVCDGRATLYMVIHIVLLTGLMMVLDVLALCEADIYLITFSAYGMIFFTFVRWILRTYLMWVETAGIAAVGRRTGPLLRFVISSLDKEHGIQQITVRTSVWMLELMAMLSAIASAVAIGFLVVSGEIMFKSEHSQFLPERSEWCQREKQFYEISMALLGISGIISLVEIAEMETSVTAERKRALVNAAGHGQPSFI
jgi:hypothetical protein